MELSCFFDDPVDVGNLISGSSAFSRTSLNTWKFTVQVLLKPSLENFEHYFTSVWDECNCAVVWAFFGIAFLWDWSENWPFPVLWPLLSFPNLLAYWVQRFHSIIFQDLKWLNWNSITSIRSVCSDAFYSQVSIKEWMDEENFVKPYGRVLLSNKNVCSTNINTFYNIDEPCKYAKWKKLETKGLILYNSTYIKCP